MTSEPGVITIDPTELKPGDVVLALGDHEIAGCHCDVRVTVLRGSDAAGGRRPVIADAARLACVSVSTVSRVLNGEKHVSPDLAARVTAAIEELGFTRDTAAYSLRAGKRKKGTS